MIREHYIKLVPALIIGMLFATECNSATTEKKTHKKKGPDFSSLPVLTTKHNNRPFNIPLPDGSVKHVRLLPLTPEEANSVSKRAAAAKPIAPSPTYTITSPAPNINGFYGSNQFPVLNQQDFGTCVTFSASAALSYLTTGTTTNVSPLYSLDQGVLDEEGLQGSGWDGLINAGEILHRLLPQYGGIPGENLGYYPNYTLTKNTYTLLSKEYEKSGAEGDLTPAQLHKSGFYKQLSAYHSMSNNTPPILFNNVTASDLNLTAGSPNNAILVKQALDKGHLVLLDFDIFDANVPAGDKCTTEGVSSMGTARYTYDASTGTLTQSPAPKGYEINSWVNATGCLLGGHQIWVISYGTDPSGHLMFVIRNSWILGDQGQYYMSESYLNTAASYAAELSLSK